MNYVRSRNMNYVKSPHLKRWKNFDKCILSYSTVSEIKKMLLITALYRRTILYKKIIFTIWDKKYNSSELTEGILSERTGKIIANKISASRTNQKGAMAPNGSANNQSSMQNIGLQRSRGEHNPHAGEHNHMANRNGQNRNGQNMTNGSVRQQIYKCCFCSSQFVYPNSVITHCEQVSYTKKLFLWFISYDVIKLFSGT